MMMAGKQRNNDLHLHECKGSRPQNRPHSSSCTGDSAKRFKATSGSADYQMESLSTRERKDRIGERVVALQQLVSPFGKTDTASVLQEATDYIRFLHEQVQVLSSPYLQSPNSQGSCGNLRNRGLCLVPLSHTNSLASDNGADIWAPQKH